MNHPRPAGLLGAVLLAVVVAACAGPAHLRTAAAPVDACDLGLATGMLVRETESGLGLEVQPGRVLPVVWPFGYSAQTDGSVVALIDPGGALVAREGDLVEAGGSANKAGEFVVCTGSVRAAPPPS